ncbi:MAG: glycosyl hydrolase family 28-related protein [Planctomycetota bacterium]|jgi:hypothetical protein
MADFPTLTKVKAINGFSKRFSQRGILPAAVRRRHQVFLELAPSIIVAPLGGEGDFTDLQKAINALREVGGGTIYLQEGVYVMSSNVALYENISLIGKGLNLSIIDFNNAEYGFYVEAVSAMSSNIHFKNLQIRNSYNYNRGAILFDHCQDCSVENCFFGFNWDPTASDGKDINLKVSRRISVIDCRSEFSGCLLTADQNSTTQNNHVMNCFAYYNNTGLAETPGTYSIISNNYSITNTGLSINLSTSDNGSRINNNSIFYKNDKGISVDAVDVSIADNYINGIANGTADGLYLGASADRTTISGNSFFFIRNGKSGIHLAAGADGAVISDNSFYGTAGTTGVTVADATCDQTVIVANFFQVATDIADSGTGTIAEHNGTL